MRKIVTCGVIVLACVATAAWGNVIISVVNQGSTTNHKVVLPTGVGGTFGIDILLDSPSDYTTTIEGNLATSVAGLAEITAYAYNTALWDSSTSSSWNPIITESGNPPPLPHRLPAASAIPTSPKPHGLWGTLALDLFGGVTGMDIKVMNATINIASANAQTGHYTLNVYNTVVGDINFGDPVPSAADSFFDIFIEPFAGKATNPSPYDTETGVALDADLAWVAGAGSSFFDVWFGLPGNMQKIGNQQTGTIFALPTLLADTTYQWRIDSYSPNGLLTTGDLWGFTTLPEPSVLVLLAAGMLMFSGRRARKS